MGFSDYMKYRRISPKDKSEIAKYVDELICYIKDGRCRYELNNIYVDEEYTNRRRTKNQRENLADACFYISKIAKEIVNRGDYIDTY